jgi:hypothetical protein
MSGPENKHAALAVLIGQPAVAHARSAVASLATSFVVGWAVMMPLWVWAAISGTLVARVLAAVAVATTAGFLARAVIHGNRSARLASDHASTELGYAVRVGCYGARLDGWQRALWRARAYHESGMRRPRIVWSTRFEDRRLQEWERRHHESSSPAPGQL